MGGEHRKRSDGFRGCQDQKMKTPIVQIPLLTWLALLGLLMGCQAGSPIAEPSKGLGGAAVAPTAKPMTQQAATATPSLAGRASNAFAAGNLDEAFDLANAALASGVQDAYLYNIRGMVYQERQDFERAIDDFGKAIRLDGSRPEFYSNRGIAWQSRADVENAERDFRQAVALGPDFATAHFNLGVLLHLIGNSSAGIPFLERVTALTPDDSEAWTQLGVLYEHTNQPARAVSAFTRAIDIERGFDDQAFYLRGLARADLLDYANAETDFSSAIDRGRTDAATYYQRGLARYKLGRSQASLADLNEAIRRDNVFIEAYYYRAFVHSVLGDQASARADAQRAIDMSNLGDPEVVK